MKYIVKNYPCYQIVNEFDENCTQYKEFVELGIIIKNAEILRLLDIQEVEEC